MVRAALVVRHGDLVLSRVIPVNPANPREERVQESVAELRKGGVLAIPTETFYGLAADAENAEAVARLNNLKGKDDRSPILLLVADVEQARAAAGEVPPRFEKLAAMFWPGPLTLVLPAGPRLPERIGGGTGTVGLRVPGLGLPRRLAGALERPITGISANRSGQPASRTAAEVAQALPEGIDLILDGGPTPGGAPSTVLDLTREHPRLLREGAVPLSALRRYLDDI
ncbi:hypothetical protein ABI59_04340 [Acidobacteria bacterium Mor1]|nr:hypothetical protein ABI59_04340 [Acidobacteria bacterium Mor1]